MKPLKYALGCAFLLLLAGLALAVWKRPKPTFSVVQHGRKLDLSLSVPGEDIWADFINRTTAQIHCTITGSEQVGGGIITGLAPFDHSLDIPEGATQAEISAQFTRFSMVARANQYLEEHWNVSVLNRWYNQVILVHYDEISLPLTPVKTGSP